jgi:hypothetical protein
MGIVSRRAGMVWLGVLGAFVMMSHDTARAQSAGNPLPWGPRAFCTDGGSDFTGHGMPNCTYYTWDQCIATARGNGQHCLANPFYKGEAAPVRKHRRHG